MRDYRLLLLTITVLATLTNTLQVHCGGPSTPDCVRPESGLPVCSHKLRSRLTLFVSIAVRQAPARRDFQKVGEQGDAGVPGGVRGYVPLVPDPPAVQVPVHAELVPSGVRPALKGSNCAVPRSRLPVLSLSW